MFSGCLTVRHVGFLKENPGDGLTVFLDFFLTKIFCKRDVKNC